jgi:hypothetical protein
MLTAAGRNGFRRVLTSPRNRPLGAIITPARFGSAFGTALGLIGTNLGPEPPTNRIRTTSAGGGSGSASSGGSFAEGPTVGGDQTILAAK